jgi:ligand-binding SRPBCC domain-containing protein
MNTFEITSHLGAAAERVWAHATDFDGINDELMPLMRMTRPRGWERIDVERVTLGQRLFRSWLLAFGVLPIDYDDITIVEGEEGRRFKERSTMLSASVWEHERTITPTNAATCQVTDRLRFTPRAAPFGPVLRRLVPVLFRHRHHRLRRRFGDASATVRTGLRS